MYIYMKKNFYLQGLMLSLALHALASFRLKVKSTV